jgi:hypothetical protein
MIVQDDLIDCGGRLGNQLFQLAAIITLAIENNTDAKLPPNIYEKETAGQKCLLYNFKHGLQTYTEEEYKLAKMDCIEFRVPEMEEDGNNIFRKLFRLVRHKNIIITGYPMSEHYFKHNKSTILEKIQLQDSLQDYGRQYIKELKDKYTKETGIENPEVVGIHIRRGDVAKVLKSDGTRLFTEEQWEKFPLSINKMKEHSFSDKKYIFLVFCGGTQNETGTEKEDIEYIKRLYLNTNTFYCDIQNTINEFAIMTSCDHFILTSSSTFSWWGAYLIKNPNKKVVALINNPTNAPLNPYVFYPDEWIQLDYELIKV